MKTRKIQDTTHAISDGRTIGSSTPARRGILIRLARTVCLLGLCLLMLAGRVSAEECCDQEEVKIGFRGKTCAWQNYEIKLNGAIASGIGTQCLSFAVFPNYTNKAWTNLKLNKTYQITAGQNLCITHINFDVPDGYVLYVDGIETNTIFKTSGGVITTGDGTWDVVVRKKCPCMGKGAGESNTSLGSVIWDAGLGDLRNGRTAEPLSIREHVLSSAIYTPASLIYSPPANTNEVDVVRTGTGNLRQVSAPQAFADVVTINSSKYEIRYYRPSDVGPKVNGIYTLTGQPYVTWELSNPDATVTTRLWISRIENGAPTGRTEYLWDPAIDSWTMSTGWSPTTLTYSRIETKSISYPTSTTRTENFVVKEANDQIVSKRTKAYFTFPWGEELVQEVLDPDGAALTTTYTYYDVASEINRFRKIKSIQFPDGSWEKYDYDEFFNVYSIMRPWKDLSMESATPSNSHMTIYGYTNSDNGEFGVSQFARYLFDVEEKINGVTVKKTHYHRAVVSVDPPMVSTTEASYSSSNNGAPENLLRQTVTTSYYFDAPQLLANRVGSIELPDGRKDTYSYEKGNYVPNANPALSEFIPDANGLAERETVVHGTTTSPDGVAFKTTKQVTVRDQFSNAVLEESYVYNGTSYERVAWCVTDYDNRGHVVMTRSHKGETTTAVWNGELKTSEIDAGGTETVYEYDSLNRLTKLTKKGIAAGGGFPAQSDIVTKFEYDAEGRRKKTTLGEGTPSVSSSRSYDRAGRVAVEVDPAGLNTTHTYTNGGRTETIIRPGGATEILNNYIDRQVKSVTGTGVVSQQVDYGVNTDGTRYTQKFIGSAGLSSPRWTKTTVDWLDRIITMEQPSFTGTNIVRSWTYNMLGQIQKQTATVNNARVIADTLYEYDELGRIRRAGRDVDNSGTLTLLSTDRVNETDVVFEKVGSDWFLVTTKKTYLTDNNDTPTIKTERERLNNFPLNGSEQTIGQVTTTDVAGNNSTMTVAIDRAAKKAITTTDIPDSTTNAVEISVNGLLQSSSPTTPQTATTYGYDSLGRQSSVVDPQTGTSSRTYNGTTGQLTSVTAGQGSTNYEYYDPKHVNAGKLMSQTDAAGKKVYFSYSNRGELSRTWGDTTYPVEYIYDSYGQRTELRTFRGGQNWTANIWPATTTGAADVTKWTYQESTGLMTQKQDAVLKGATYTYDELGRMKTRTWARGITSTYGYDASAGELRTITYSDSTPAVSYTFDRGGRKTGVTDAAGAHTRTFNVAGALQSEQITGGILDGVTLTVGYDGFLRRNSLQAVQGANTLSSQTYGYDPTSRLDTITSGSQTVTYAYYQNSGLLNTTTFTGGTNTARGYDSFGRLQNITNTPAADVAQSYTYTYNNLDQRTRVTREDGSYWSYVYNDRGDLKSGKKYWSDNSLVWGAQSEYLFDNIGNRTSTKSGGNQLSVLRQSTLTNNSLNQSTQRTVPGAIDVTGTANTQATVSVNNLSSHRKGDYFYKELAIDNSTGSVHPQVNVVGARNNFGAGGQDVVKEEGGRIFIPSAVESFSFDDDGNLTSDGRWTYVWDGENRLRSIEALATVPDSAKQRLEFSYDDTGRRTEKKIYTWNSGLATYQLQSTNRFVYDQANLVAQFDGASSTGFVWGLDVAGALHAAGGTGALLLTTAGAETYLTSYDGNGNVVGLIKAGTGKHAALYEYDGFGNTVKSVGEYAHANRFRFSTKYADVETGLIFYGRRYYRAETGQWISRDPLEEAGGVNLYSHVSNDAVNSYDAVGLQDQRPSRDDTRKYVKRDSFRSDYFGIQIADHWLGGTGTEWDIDGESMFKGHWKAYMTAFNRHTMGFGTQYVDTIRDKLKNIAWSMADSPDGTKRPVDLTFFGELLNGEGMIGYEYLHGTNASEIPPPTDFQMQGQATKVKGGRTDCLQVDFDIVYRWNDLMDPKLEYTSDRIKSTIAKSIFNAKDYILRIRWRSPSSYLMINGKDESSGWPFAPPKYGSPNEDMKYGYVP